MDWRRGSFRLWLVMSALWVGWRAYLATVEAFNWTETRKLLGMEPAPLFTDVNAVNVLAGAFGPPIAVLVLGWAVIWIAQGFRRPAR